MLAGQSPQLVGQQFGAWRPHGTPYAQTRSTACGAAAGHCQGGRGSADGQGPTKLLQELGNEQTQQTRLHSLAPTIADKVVGLGPIADKLPTKLSGWAPSLQHHTVHGDMPGRRRTGKREALADSTRIGPATRSDAKLENRVDSDKGSRGSSRGATARVSDKNYTGPRLQDVPRDSPKAPKRWVQGLVRATGGTAQVMQTRGTSGADTAGGAGKSVSRKAKLVHQPKGFAISAGAWASGPARASASCATLKRAADVSQSVGLRRMLPSRQGRLEIPVTESRSRQVK